MNPPPGRRPRPVLPQSAGHPSMVRTHPLAEDELSRLAIEAPPAELELVLVHPQVTVQHVLLALKNAAITTRLLERIGMDRRWAKSYPVKLALVMHPRSPRHIAIRYVKFLYLGHLLRLIDDHMTAPGLKRQAEGLLRERLPQITLGERLTMAKCGGRGVLRVVRGDPDPNVLQALLQNPKLTSVEVVALIDSSTTPPAVLHALAAHRRWSKEYGVRLAFARTPHAPAGLALGSLSSLLKRDLIEISRSQVVRPVVRSAAARVLDARAEAMKNAGSPVTADRAPGP